MDQARELEESQRLLPEGQLLGIDQTELVCSEYQVIGYQILIQEKSGVERVEELVWIHEKESE